MLQAVGKNVILEIVTKVDDYADGVKQRSNLLIDRSKIQQSQPTMGIVYSIGQAVPADHDYQLNDKVHFQTEDIFQGYDFDGKKLVTVKHEDIRAIL